MIMSKLLCNCFSKKENNVNFSFKKISELLDKKDFNGIFNYIAGYVPNKLYKYYYLYEEDNEYAIEENKKRFNTLEQNKIWLSSFDKFNDPFEAENMYMDINKMKELGCSEEYIEQIRVVQNMIKSSYKVASFSSHLNECMPMWAHYANNYKGYCVEYEIVKKRAVFPVFYENTRNSSTIFVRIANDLLKCGKNPTKELQDLVLQEAMVLMLSYCIKHKSWEYENEYRVLIPDHDNLKLCEELGLKPVKIYAGLKTATSHIQRLQEISSKLGLGDIAKCSINAKNYQLDFH